MEIHKKKMEKENAAPTDREKLSKKELKKLEKAERKKARREAKEERRKKEQEIQDAMRKEEERIKVRIVWFRSKISRFLERILMEHIGMKNSAHS